MRYTPIKLKLYKTMKKLIVSFIVICSTLISYGQLSVGSLSAGTNNFYNVHLPNFGKI